MIDLNEVSPLRDDDERDLDDLSDRLGDCARYWVPQYFANGRVDGTKLRLANIRGDAPSKNGSCIIDLAGDHAGCWREHDPRCADAGGPLSTLSKATGLRGRELLDLAEQIIGGGTPRRRRRRETPPNNIDQTINIVHAQHIVNHAQPAAGTLVETYLRSRGLALPDCRDLLFHPDLPDYDAAIGRPGLIAIIRRSDTGEPTGGVHRTHLADDGSGKADMDRPKRMLGPSDGVVMLAPMKADGELGVGEGIESTLAGSQIFGIPAWSTLSTAGMQSFAFPPGLRRLTIFADRGAPGEDAAADLWRRARNAGFDARVCLPHSDDDFAKDVELGSHTEKYQFFQPAPSQGQLKADPVGDMLPGSSIELIHFHDMVPRIDDRWIVDGLLNAGEFSLVVGASGTAKTFFAVDLGLRVADGQELFGRATRRHGVVYIATEAGRGIENRVCAYKQYYPSMPADLPFAAVVSPVNLRHAGTCDRVYDKIMKAGISEPVGLIIVDTLSRGMGGGDENSSADMGAFVVNMDELRQRTGAHVLIVHHLGKDQSRGARGHSLLRAAVDTEIVVTRDDATGISTATVTKQRELPLGGQMHYWLRTVELGRRPSDDRPVTSCVVEAVEALPIGTTAKRAIPPSQKRAYDLLIDAIARHGVIPPANNYIPPGRSCVTEDTWRRVCDAGEISPTDTPDAKRKAFKRAARALVAAARVGKWEQWVWVV
jgi:hypothetical protein